MTDTDTTQAESQETPDVESPAPEEVIQALKEQLAEKDKRLERYSSWERQVETYAMRCQSLANRVSDRREEAASAKSALKAAEDEYLDEVKTLRAMCIPDSVAYPLLANLKDEQAETAAEPEETPPPLDERWRDCPVTVLKGRPRITDKLIDTLAGMDVQTLGQWSEWLNKGHQHVDLAGVGEAAATLIDEAWDWFWEEHPLGIAARQSQQAQAQWEAERDGESPDAAPSDESDDGKEEPADVRDWQLVPIDGLEVDAEKGFNDEKADKLADVLRSEHLIETAGELVGALTNDDECQQTDNVIETILRILSSDDWAWLRASLEEMSGQKLPGSRAERLDEGETEADETVCQICGTTGSMDEVLYCDCGGAFCDEHIEPSAHDCVHLQANNDEAA